MKKTEPSSPITDGHIAAVAWMRSAQFRAIKRHYDEVFGEYRCFFRPTDNQVTVISLDDDCPRFIGIRRSEGDKSCYLPVNSEVKGRRYYEILFDDFQSFKASAHPKPEEQTVIQFLSRALRNNLVLDGSLPSHLLINHEWRFRVDHPSRKADVIAVNTNDWRLCIIEFKSRDEILKRSEAMQAARDYARLFAKDSRMYALFFKAQLQVMGKLYNNSQATSGTVMELEPEQYFAYRSKDGSTVFERIN